MTPRWPLVIVSGCVASILGCASPVPGQPTASAPATTSTPTPTSAASATAKPPPRLAPAVRQPLDARGVEPCELMTPAQLVELGLRPESAKPGTSGASLTCTWVSATDAANPAGLQINADSTLPALDGIYLVPETFAVFEPIEVAGHPAVHADDVAGPVCTIYTAIADYQAVATDGNLGGRPLPDPCAPSRRMAEMILSNLPPLR